jgi:hypothetical protein
MQGSPSKIVGTNGLSGAWWGHTLGRSSNDRSRSALQQSEILARSKTVGRPADAGAIRVRFSTGPSGRAAVQIDKVVTATLCGSFPQPFTTECERDPQLVRPRKQLLQSRLPNVGTGP